MATTSLWHIKGRLKDLIDYVENPERPYQKTNTCRIFTMFFPMSVDLKQQKTASMFPPLTA